MRENVILWFFLRYSIPFSYTKRGSARNYLTSNKNVSRRENCSDIKGKKKILYAIKNFYLPFFSFSFRMKSVSPIAIMPSKCSHYCAQYLHLLPLLINFYLHPFFSYLYLSVAGVVPKNITCLRSITLL